MVAATYRAFGLSFLNPLGLSSTSHICHDNKYINAIITTGKLLLIVYLFPISQERIMRK